MLIHFHHSPGQLRLCPWLPKAKWHGKHSKYKFSCAPGFPGVTCFAQENNKSEKEKMEKKHGGTTSKTQTNYMPCVVSDEKKQRDKYWTETGKGFFN